MAADGSVVIEILGDAKDFAQKLGDLAVKASGAFVAASAAGIAAITKTSVSAYAEYEQLVGGVETLFKDSAGIVEQYAANAYQTAGMSANKYMSTVTSFSASLLQGLGGDTEKAAEIANIAVTDMSDNANKMGTSMEAIENAYQGFAKQNYTMLDNLKLGYGGTQSEMIRLINDSGILNEEISSLDGITFDQMIAAIHEIQTQMGITGTTAAEASSTIEGSLNSLKGAWENLMTGLASGENIDVLLQNVIDSAVTFGENLIPRIQQILMSVGQAFEYLVPIVIQGLPGVVAAILPGFISAISSLASSIGATVLEYGPQMLQSGLELIGRLTEGVRQKFPELISIAMEALLNFSSGLRENFSQVFDAGLELITALAESLIDNIPVFIETVPTIITNLCGLINDNAPKLITAGLELIAHLAEGLIQAIPTLIANIPQILEAIVAVFSAFNWVSLGSTVVNGIRSGLSMLSTALKEAATNALNAFQSGNWIGTGGKVISLVANAIHSAAGLVLSALRAIGTNGLNAFRSINWASVGKAAINFIANAARGAVGFVASALKSVGTSAMNAFRSINWASLGRNIISGIVSGIGGAAGALFSKLRSLASGALGAAKKALGIASPSRLFRSEVGRWIPPGIGDGIEDAMPELKKRMTNTLDMLADNIQADVRGSRTQQSVRAAIVGSAGRSGATSVVNNFNQTINSPKALSRREIIRETKNVARRLRTV